VAVAVAVVVAVAVTVAAAAVVAVAVVAAVVAIAAAVVAAKACTESFYSLWCMIVLLSLAALNIKSKRPWKKLLHF
jgi:hypothetical protein